ncbi:COMPASS (complex proteins associated with Set1p) component [Neurospora sp. IMI 360204]|nr:COMPASS (complex proteins associated with Set1p) component [Neurospora sp. IMI 360204]
MAANEPLLGQASTDDVNMTDAHHHHIPDRPPHPVSPVPIPQIPGRPSPTGAHPTANQGPSAIRSTAPATNGSTTTEEQQLQPLPPYQQRAGSSRAASAHPQDSGQGQQQGPGLMGTAGMPTEPTLHGAPVRQYLNTKVTGHLLEGMKMLAKEQPKDPLRALGEFLLQRSKQYEGGGANGSSTSA